MTFVDFDIWHRMASLRKLFSMALTNFLKVKELNWDLSIVANNHSGETCASKDSNRDPSTAASNHSGATFTSKDSNWDLPKVVNTHSCLKCKWLLSCSCKFASTCMAPAVELILLVESFVLINVSLFEPLSVAWAD